MTDRGPFNIEGKVYMFLIVILLRPNQVFLDTKSAAGDQHDAPPLIEGACFTL